MVRHLLLLATASFLIQIVFSQICPQKVTAPDGTVYELGPFINQAPWTTPGDQKSPQYDYKFIFCGQPFSCGQGVCASGTGGACQTWGNFVPSSSACIGQQLQAPTGLNGRQGVQIEFLNGDVITGVGARTSTLIIKCDPNAKEDRFEADDRQSGGGKFQLFVHTSKKEICGGSSPGGGGEGGDIGGIVFLAIFFGAIILYLLVGVIVNKVVRKQEGAEVIPNWEFWRGLPGMVRDGTLFIFRCGKGSYSAV
eukprot:TRINITY_DN247_c0_g1_i1.p1 TRINITY_DN247_c0_g1~~TRINITY_DN247_c0_g1_i1.p1  ORF type:complete len:252 (-),score=41.39 TRINITY_DN247_c0_g1_i1:74-829(-)